MILVAFDERWAELFAEEAALVRNALGDRVLAVEHIGSTAVPGLVGKPVIDLLAGLAGPLSPRNNRALKRLGYAHLRARRDGRLVFRKGAPRAYSLHVTEHGSDQWRAALAFRDYLRANADAAEEYRQLKITLAELGAAAYARRKSVFVSHTLRRLASAPPPEGLWPTPGVEPSEN
jgi:GrpB-like predicted nucleotidyltransferase (UPF0157 family)